MTSKSITTLFHIIKTENNIILGLYNPQTGLIRKASRRWKLRDLTSFLDAQTDGFFEPLWTRDANLTDIAEVNRISLEAKELDGDIILNVMVKGGSVTEQIKDSHVTVRGAVVKELKLNYTTENITEAGENIIGLDAKELDNNLTLNVTVKGGSATGSIEDSNVTIKGAAIKNLKYNLFIDGGSIHDTTNSEVVFEGVQFG